MDQKSKNRRRPAEGFKKFPLFLRLLINITRNAALQIKGMKMPQCCLVSYWLIAGIWAFSNGFPIPSRNCPEAIQ
jgi:hypothetical protein